MADHQVNYADLQSVADTFLKEVGELQTLQKQIEAMAVLLRSEYFCGLVGNRFNESSLEEVTVLIQSISREYSRLDTNITQAIQRYKAADDEKKGHVEGGS